MMVGNFVGMIYFGMLCMVTIIFALAADLLLLPVVLRWHAGETEALGAPAAIEENAGIDDTSHPVHPA